LLSGRRKVFHITER